MPRRRSSLQQLKISLSKARAENDVMLYGELKQVHSAIQQPWSITFTALTKLLKSANSQVTKHYIADVFGASKDPRVLKPLMFAAKAADNKNYSANFLFPCAEYDCTAYVNFFVQFLLQCQEPDESMVSCVAVIEEMQGPFEANTIKRNVAKLLGRNRSKISTEFQIQDEVLTIQVGYALLDKYFGQIDKKWKAEILTSSN